MIILSALTEGKSREALARAGIREQEEKWGQKPPTISPHYIPVEGYHLSSYMKVQRNPVRLPLRSLIDCDHVTTGKLLIDRNHVARNANFRGTNL